MRQKLQQKKNIKEKKQKNEYKRKTGPLCIKMAIAQSDNYFIRSWLLQKNVQKFLFLIKYYRKQKQTNKHTHIHTYIFRKRNRMEYYN